MGHTVNAGTKNKKSIRAQKMVVYDALLHRLYQVNKFQAVKMGLENMKQMDRLLGHPSLAYDVVHVAGTNGKGSVSWKLAKTLETTLGCRTGLFVSPHIACFRERIQVNGSFITEAQVEALLPVVFQLAQDHGIPATFFEFTTLLAMLHFQRMKTDVVVFETGLGGRLDATNIVSPCLTVITSIGYDHVGILGSSLAEITREKAGIIKPEVPVVIGPSVDYALVASQAQRLRAPVRQLPRAWTSLEDDFEQENTALAALALKELGQAIATKRVRLVGSPLAALSSTSPASWTGSLQSRPPCRFEVIPPSASAQRKAWCILDVAHNPAAISSLLKKLNHCSNGLQTPH